MKSIKLFLLTFLLLGAVTVFSQQATAVQSKTGNETTMDQADRTLTPPDVPYMAQGGEEALSNSNATDVSEPEGDLQNDPDTNNPEMKPDLPRNNPTSGEIEEEIQPADGAAYQGPNPDEDPNATSPADK